jgi:steroid delta-isomerase-like uncharacterized protein
VTAWWIRRSRSTKTVLAAAVSISIVGFIARLRRRLQRRAKGAPMGTETNKEIIRRLAEEPWRGNFDVVDEHVADDYVGHDPSNPEPLRGPAGVKEFIRTYRTAFRDARVTVEEQLAEGDFVATRWTGRGIHEGELMGIQPTGKEATVSGITISRLRNDKVVEEWSNWDTLGMLVQLGAVPEPART